MSNSLIKLQSENNIISYQEDYEQINSMVENLLESLNQGKEKRPKSRSKKKWQRIPKKKKDLDDLRIRELPFTF